MKLIYCPNCQDVLKLRQQQTNRRCGCGKSFGRYIDEHHAVIGGNAVPIGFAWDSFADALANRPAVGDGRRFQAWVMPLQVPSMTSADGKGVRTYGTRGGRSCMMGVR